jgi:hypothetical protein
VHSHVGFGGSHVAGLASVKVVALTWFVHTLLPNPSVLEPVIGTRVPGGGHLMLTPKKPPMLPYVPTWRGAGGRGGRGRGGKQVQGHRRKRGDGLEAMQELVPAGLQCNSAPPPGFVDRRAPTIILEHRESRKIVVTDLCRIHEKTSVASGEVVLQARGARGNVDWAGRLSIDVGWLWQAAPTPKRGWPIRTTRPIGPLVRRRT